MSLASDIIAKIKSMDPPLFRVIEGVGAFTALTSNPNMTPALPAAYVVIEHENSGENERTTGSEVLQLCQADVAVVILTANLTDASGGVAGEDLETLKEAVRHALIGFCPDQSAGYPVQHVEANILKFKNNVVWHRELFVASQYLEGKSA